MANERRSLLLDLVERRRPVSETVRLLSTFAFDSSPIVIVGKDDVIKILSSYLNGNVSEADIEEWANAIEVRDDLDYGADHGAVVKEIIFELANPILSGPLTPAEAQGYMSSLQMA